MDWCFGWICEYAKGKSIECGKEELLGLLPTVPEDDQIVLEIINWVNFVPNYLQNGSLSSWSLQRLQDALAHATYLVGSAVTIADLAVWSSLASDSGYHKLLSDGPANPSAFQSDLCHVRRYYTHLNSMESLSKWKEALQLWRVNQPVHITDAASATQPSGMSGKTTAAEMRFEMDGKFGELPGAKIGEAVVSVPPEASGYLHIGHAKAALLNQHYRNIFEGRLILRFDDTDPSKEKEIYEESILSDLPRLGVCWDVRSHTSDHFELLLKLCEQMIRDGKA
ncbi:hypothetical protein P879_09425 [Paragonimus westermani]|uniref:Glutamyl/glutaminyl-tRNA synthetase class Ib catalytic domain-containing protein n=1 Tax=Paragonimus westermani TaxID=34504 RepID=A0A8T0D6W1_9TREM|nr:hypothetical protein P879_09425 [Paragonimus westermani]